MIAEHGYAGCGGWSGCGINGVKDSGCRALFDVWGRIMENTHNNRSSKHQKSMREIWHIFKVMLLGVTMYLLFIDAIALKALTGITDMASQIGAPEDIAALLSIPFVACTVFSLLLFLFD